MNDYYIKAENIGKKFQIKEGGKSQGLSLTTTEMLLQFLSRKPKKDFWGVRGVDVAILPGDCIGLVGDNGSGKTTLLKTLYNIFYLSEGVLKTRGDIGGILEGDVAYNRELTGRENYGLFAALWNMNKQEAKDKYDDIVAFANMEDMIDLPAKFYSQGMLMRFAVSILLHSENAVYLMDEAMVHVDETFQKACFKLIKDKYQNEQKAFIITSHHMEDLQNLCNKIMWIDNGKIVEYSADVKETLGRYAAHA